MQRKLELVLVSTEDADNSVGQLDALYGQLESSALRVINAGAELDSAIDNIFPLDLAMQAGSEPLMEVFMAHRAPCSNASVAALITSVGPVSGAIVMVNCVARRSVMDANV